MEISGSQIKLLKRLYKTDIPLSDFSESEKGEIEYLGKRGFIKYSKEDTDSRITPTIVCICWRILSCDRIHFVFVNVNIDYLSRFVQCK